MQEIIAVDIETAADETIAKELFDILLEDAGDKKNSDKAIEKFKSALGLSPMTGKICCFGYRRGTHAAGSNKIEWQDQKPVVRASENEIELLHIAAGLFQDSGQLTTLVTFNGKSFDVPFIKVRAAIKGIALHYKIRESKYDLGSHFDVRSALTNFEQFGKGTLTQWAYRFGIPVPNPELEGSMIQQLYDLREFTSIENHNSSDLMITSQLYERIFMYY